MPNGSHGIPIEILLVEDNPDDADLTIDALRSGRHLGGRQAFLALFQWGRRQEVACPLIGGSAGAASLPSTRRPARRLGHSPGDVVTATSVRNGQRQDANVTPDATE
jgi:hypothetical protein